MILDITTLLLHWTKIQLQECYISSITPPDSDKYVALKTRLLDTFGLSPRQRASRLLHFRPLGDSKPSALMDEMLALVADHTPCLLFEQLFLERLPEDIRIQLVDTKFDDLRHLARRADALWSSRDMELSSVNATSQRSKSRQANHKSVNKPVRMDISQPVQVAVPKSRGRPKQNRKPPHTKPPNTPPISTRSGRKVKKPQRYSVLEGSGVAVQTYRPYT